MITLKIYSWNTCGCSLCVDDRATMVARMNSVSERLMCEWAVVSTARDLIRHAGKTLTLSMVMLSALECQESDSKPRNGVQVLSLSSNCSVSIGLDGIVVS